ncbi:MAG: hypothetical protein WB973_19560 [Thermoanaerobaculia bacterium]
MTTGPQPPVTPKQQLLPLLAITPEQFQSFCRDLVKELPGIVECHQHGVQGDPQHGIDLVATTDSTETCPRSKRPPIPTDVRCSAT